MLRSSYIPAFILLLVVNVSCKSGHSDAPGMSDSVVVDFYARSLIVKEEEKILGGDSSRVAVRIDSLRTACHVTKSHVDSLITEYQKDLRQWRMFGDNVIKRLETIQREESPPLKLWTP